MPGRRGEERTALLTFYAVTALVIAFDQISKFFAQFYLPLSTSIQVFPGIFNLTLVFNRGIAFGLFRDQGPLLILIISVSLAVLLYLSRKIQELPVLSRLGFAMILGGAIGNWIDRIRLGHVIDFLDFRIWPVFNIADSAISIGVALYLIHLLKTSKQSS
jgi:signal peptidase II